jgi:hypothetical protein
MCGCLAAMNARSSRRLAWLHHIARFTLHIQPHSRRAPAMRCAKAGSACSPHALQTTSSLDIAPTTCSAHQVSVIMDPSTAGCMAAMCRSNRVRPSGKVQGSGDASLFPRGARRAQPQPIPWPLTKEKIAGVARLPQVPHMMSSLELCPLTCSVHHASVILEQFASGQVAARSAKQRSRPSNVVQRGPPLQWHPRPWPLARFLMVGEAEAPQLPQCSDSFDA